MTDRNEIERIHARWIALEKSGKTPDVLGLCHPDVAWLVPGRGLLVGVAEIRAFLDEQPDSVILSLETSDVDVEISGALAVKRANFRTTWTEAGKEREVAGSHIWTLRKPGAGGGWLVTNVAWVIKAPSDVE